MRRNSFPWLYIAITAVIVFIFKDKLSPLVEKLKGMFNKNQ